MKLMKKNSYAKIASGFLIVILSGLLWIELQNTPVTMVVNGVERAILSDAETVGELLQEQGIVLTENDKLFPAKDSQLKANMEITYEKAILVELVDGNEFKELWTTTTTVEEFLNANGITLRDYDEVEPALDKQLLQGQQITITRIEKEVIKEEETIDYDVVQKEDSNLTSGKKKVVQSGKSGTKVKRYEVTYINGVKIKKALIDEEVIKQPQKEIIAIGTKPKVVQTYNQMPAGETFEVVATAYTALCDSGCTGITATGINLLENPHLKVIAVDPRVIPLGTNVYVEGYGYAIAGDTGGAIKGYKIDVFIQTKDEARRWGRKTVKITILD